MKSVYSIISQKNYIVKVVVDEEEDIAFLPTTQWTPGCSCLVLETRDTFMLNNSFEWVKIRNGNIGGGGTEETNGGSFNSQNTIQLESFDNLPNPKTADENKIYLVPSPDNTGDNEFDEYFVVKEEVNGEIVTRWEKIGQSLEEINDIGSLWDSYTL